jgi:hypothetical protein
MQSRNNIARAPDRHSKPVLPVRQISFAVFVIAMVMTATAYADIAFNLIMPQAANSRPLPPQYRIEADGSVELRLCFNSSCARTEMLTFSAADMEKVKEQLGYCPGEPLYDRLQRVRIAVWQMEVLAQKYEPLLAYDREVNDREYGVEGRMDCVDNASNTTTYLAILMDLGQLPSWRVGESRVRKPLDFNAMHWTAVLEDEVTGKEWAVDSWFRPNGHLPFVLPFAAWMAETRGWLPPHDALNPYPHAINELCRQ